MSASVLPELAKKRVFNEKTGKFYAKGDMIFHFEDDNQKRGVDPKFIKFNKRKSGHNTAGDRVLSFSITDPKILESDNDGNVCVKSHSFTTVEKKK